VTPKSPEFTLSVTYNNFRLKAVDNVNFLGIYLDCQLNWKKHAKKLLKKLNIACFMLRKLQFLVSEQILRMICFSYCQSQLEYGIIFWSSSLVMKSLFVAQKRVIRVMLRLGPRDSCREGFKRLGILTVPSLYIYSVLMFVVRNLNFYQTNNNIHQINTRQFRMLCMSSVRLSSIKRGVLYSSIMVFNNLPQNLRKMSDSVFSQQMLFIQWMNIFLLSIYSI
jgi:hypothetical protein